ncbi:MAG: hypothetical protein AAFU56_05570 [Pseudomonadota bacterium]
MNLASKAFAIAISFATVLAAAAPAQAANFRAPAVAAENSNIIEVGKRHRRGAAIVGGIVLGAIIGGAIARDHDRHYGGRYYSKRRYYGKRRYYRGHKRYYKRYGHGHRNWRHRGHRGHWNH